MQPSPRSPRRPPYRVVIERPVRGSIPFLSNPEWTARFPGVRQGTTHPGPDRGFDLGGGGAQARERWDALALSLGFQRLVHGRQVHGSTVVTHGPGPRGRFATDGCDGHVTTTPGTLLAVVTADCVPVHLATEDGGGVGLLHAGWRGTAAGVLKAGIEALTRAADTGPGAVHVHLGPAICGDCYEVGPEVHRALGLPDPGRPTPVDLRGVLADQAAALGVDPAHVTASSMCTRCDAPRLYSHRAGDAGRQVAVLGIEAPQGTRPPPAPDA